MAQRGTFWLLLGLGAGFALGWLSGKPGEEAMRPLPLPATGPPTAALPAEVAEAPAAGPRLGGRGEEVGRLEAPGDLVDLDDVTEPSRKQQGWAARLTLLALDGDVPRFLASVSAALEAGVTTDQVLALAALFPPASRSRVAAGLPPAPSGQAWEPSTIAALHLVAGAVDEAMAVVEASTGGTITPAIVRQLIAADPAAGAAALEHLLHEKAPAMVLLAAVTAALAEEGRGDLAVPFLQRRLEIQPYDHDALMAVVAVDPRWAVAHAIDLTRRHGEDAAPWAWLGQLHADAGRPSDAFDAFREAAERELTVQHVQGMLQADPARALEVMLALAGDATDDEMLGNIAKLAMAARGREAALDLLLRAHQLDPTDNEWMNAIVALDPARAAEVIGRTASTYHGDSRDEVIGNHANALRDLGRHEEAFERFREAFELDPGDWEWQRGLAATNPARAIPLLERQREVQGDDGDLLGALADAYAGVGRTGDAMVLYERALDSGGGEEWMAHMRHADPAAAEAHLRSALDVNPTSALLWGHLGDVLRDQGRTDEARRAYDQARTYDDTSILWQARYAELAEGSGR